MRVRNSRAFESVGASGPTHACILPIPIDNIASGVRLSARLRKNNTNLTAWTVAITYLQKPLTSTLLTTVVAQKAIPPAAAGVTVTAGSPAWANGTWAQLRAAAGAALVLTGVVLGPSANNVEYELDFGTGGAGTETVITTIRVTSSNSGCPSFFLLPTPLDNVAASTRLAVRLRSATASATVNVGLMVVEKPL